MAEEIKSFIPEGFNPETCSLEELKSMIEQMHDKEDFYESKQLGEKLFLNSMYGAVSSKYFIGFNLEVSKSITLQGQDLNHFSENCVNRYFNGIFQNDTELHKKLGVSTEDAKKVVINKGSISGVHFYSEEEKKKSGMEHLEGDYSTCVAGDTDSIYVEFGRFVRQLNIPDEKQTEFVVNLWNYGCGPYMEKCYDAYAKYYQCKENLEVLELEKVCRTTILYAKKHYAMEEVWEEPGVYLPDMTNIIYKGLEVIQGSTPPYARKCQKEMIEFVLRNYMHSDEKPEFTDLVSMLKKFRKEMEAQPVDEIAKSMNISDYDKFILEDKGRIVIAVNGQTGKQMTVPIHVRASAYHNYLLYKNKQYLSKYQIIRSKDKVKMYYTKTNKDNIDIFAYIPGSYPYEFAPAIDYDLQFEKTILEPLNRLIEILGYQRMTSSLAYTEELF